MKRIFISTIMLIVIFSSLLNAALKSERLEAFNKSINAEADYNYKEAIEPLLKIYDNYASDYLVNLRLGWLYYKINKFDESLRYYYKAVKISDNSVEALLGLTLPLSSQNKWDEIEDVYKRILDKDEQNYTANLNLGKYYFNTKNFLNAKIYLNKLFENYPSDYSANLYLGWTLYFLGDNSNAAEHFERALIANPGDSSAQEGLNLVK